MILIPAGSFEMGSVDGSEFEKPCRDLYLADYYLDETPVTNAEFTEFVQATGYRTSAEQVGYAWGYSNGAFGFINDLSWQTYAVSGREYHPVVLASWYDADAYCHWAHKRLPTEAEWEKAARGGMKARIFPWGDESPDGSQSNFARPPSELPPTTEVRKFASNSYGLFDMVGNVWQWCADEPAPYYQEPAAKPKAEEAAAVALRVRRGGSWNVIQSFRLRCSNRGAAPATSCAPNMGFRCAR